MRAQVGEAHKPFPTDLTKVFLDTSMRIQVGVQGLFVNKAFATNVAGMVTDPVNFEPVLGKLLPLLEAFSANITLFHVSQFVCQASVEGQVSDLRKAHAADFTLEVFQYPVLSTAVCLQVQEFFELFPTVFAVKESVIHTNLAWVFCLHVPAQHELGKKLIAYAALCCQTLFSC